MAPILILRWQETTFSLTVALRLLTTTMDSVKSVYLTSICQSSHCNVSDCLFVCWLLLFVVLDRPGSVSFAGQALFLSFKPRLKMPNRSGLGSRKN